MAAYSSTTHRDHSRPTTFTIDEIGAAPRPPVVLSPPIAPTDSFYTRHGKRAIDIVGASLVLCMFAPLLALTWVALRIVLGPRVVITQERVGRDGLDFSMYKFRTMQWSRRRAMRKFRGPDRRRTHKSDRDPRHTFIGRILRKASIDELPQLVNVLRGEMSLVGPRPEMVAVADSHHLRNHPRHLVAPGLTGLWQVTARQDGALLHESVHVDVDYLTDISMRGDLRILAATASAVLRGDGR